MSEFLVQRDGTTAVVTVSNPAKRNAISRDMWQRLPDLLDELTADASVRVVVLTGAGDTFCAGNDISGIRHGADTDLPSAGVQALLAFPKPVVAAISGYCIGAGAELALACDLRVAGDDAQFGVPPANLGLVFPLTGLRLLLDAVGPAQAKRLVYTGERIDAAEALRIGLVDEVVPAVGALPHALRLAGRIASRSQLTIRAAKAMIAAVQDGTDADAVTAHWRELAASGPDLPEGRAAFADKREPRFTWNG